jgi:hypothetical protein
MRKEGTLILKSGVFKRGGSPSFYYLPLPAGKGDKGGWGNYA